MEGGATMLAVRLHAPGGPEQLDLDRVAIPAPGARDVLVRVEAAAITRGELAWESTLKDRDGVCRLPSIPSHEVAGVVAGIGGGVTSAKPGDQVFGLTDFYRDGVAAEYALVADDVLARRPAGLPHDEAAALSLAGLTAWQGLFVHGELEPGRRVLVHGGAGGVGGLAVQLAAWAGSDVVATASTASIQLARALGASKVVDYTASRFEDEVHDVDLVFDTVGGETLARSFAVVEAGGAIVSCAEEPKAPAGSSGVRTAYYVVEPDVAQLTQLARLAVSGEIRVPVGEAFALENAREAFARTLAEHRQGKVVLHVPA